MARNRLQAVIVLMAIGAAFSAMGDPAAAYVPPGDTSAKLKARDVGSVDKLMFEVGSATRKGIHVCVDAVRETGGRTTLEQGCAYYPPVLDSPYYDFDVERWRASAEIELKTARWDWVDGRSQPRKRVAAAAIDLSFAGIGERRYTPLVGGGLCGWGIPCAWTGVRIERDAKVRGTIELRGLETTIHLRDLEVGDLRWGVTVPP